MGPGLGEVDSRDELAGSKSLVGQSYSHKVRLGYKVNQLGPFER